MIRRPPRSTQSRSSAASDVYKRQVREVADRITVIRLGKVVGEASPTATNNELASLMVGRPIDLTIEKGPQEPGEAALVVTDLSVIDHQGQLVVNHISFEVRAGEILALSLIHISEPTR